MGEIASRAQLRMAFLRWALVLVPAVLLLGFLSGWLAGSGYGNAWFAALEKPALNPPAWVFPAAWTALYILMGVALALVVAARGARRRGAAIALFLLGFALNLAWSPLFFGLHQVQAALILIVAMFLVSAAAAALFALVRPVAGALMIPYLLWLIFAAWLTFEIGRLNPGAEALVPPAATTHIQL